MKSLATSPPRKDTIPNRYINMFETERYQSIPPKLAKFCPRYKSIINELEDGHNESTDTSRTDKENCLDILKAINNKNIDD